MASGPPFQTYRDLVADLYRRGARKVRQRGSHAVFELPDGSHFTVPVQHLARRPSRHILACYRRQLTSSQPS